MIAKYAAFLRGINVGGHKPTAAQLIAAFEACELEDVSTFRASGNVLFESAGRGKPKAQEMEAALEEELGYGVPVFVRSAAEIDKVARLEPFTVEQRKASEGKLQVAFLRKEPSGAKAKDALALATEEPLAIEGKELFWLPKAGILDSDVDLKALEKLVGPWTMRTMGTVEQMAAKL